MLERNILTFNPGWDGDANTLPAFTDVRDPQRELKAKSIPLLSESDETTWGQRASWWRIRMAIRSWSTSMFESLGQA